MISESLRAAVTARRTITKHAQDAGKNHTQGHGMNRDNSQHHDGGGLHGSGGLPFGVPQDAQAATCC